MTQLNEDVLNEQALSWSVDTDTLTEGFKPLTNLFMSSRPISQEDLSTALDAVQQALQTQEFTHSLSSLAEALREKNILPNEKSTENLITFLVDQATKRSPIPIPSKIVEQLAAAIETVAVNVANAPHHRCLVSPAGVASHVNATWSPTPDQRGACGVGHTVVLHPGKMDLAGECGHPSYL